MKNRQFWVIVLCFLWLFGLLFVANNNTQKQNLFEKSVMCRNLYLSQSNYLKEHYYLNNDGLERRWVSDVATFYSKDLDTCVVAYQIHYRDDTNDANNGDNYVLENVKEWAENHYWFIRACSSDDTCDTQWDKKKSELK